MKQILLIVVILSLFGCENHKFIHDANDVIMAAKAEEYLKSRTVENQNKPIFNKTNIINDDPVLYVYSAQPYFEFKPNVDEATIFLMMKEIYCSDEPFAKELVEKYKITSDTINCELN